MAKTQEPASFTLKPTLSSEALRVRLREAHVRAARRRRSSPETPLEADPAFLGLEDDSRSEGA